LEEWWGRKREAGKDNAFTDQDAIKGYVMNILIKNESPQMSCGATRALRNKGYGTEFAIVILHLHAILCYPFMCRIFIFTIPRPAGSG